MIRDSLDGRHGTARKPLRVSPVAPRTTEARSTATTRHANATRSAEGPISTTRPPSGGGRLDEGDEEPGEKIHNPRAEPTAKTDHDHESVFVGWSGAGVYPISVGPTSLRGRSKADPPLLWENLSSGPSRIARSVPNHSGDGGRVARPPSIESAPNSVCPNWTHRFALTN